jgi:hypothetical protein
MIYILFTFCSGNIKNNNGMKEKLKNWSIQFTGILISSAFLFSIIIASCAKDNFDPPSVDPNIPLSFEADVLPIFTENCVACHGGSIPPDLSESKAYESISDGYISDDPENDPESSIIYSKLLESGHSANATELEKLIILTWILQGAKDN